MMTDCSGESDSGTGRSVLTNGSDNMNSETIGPVYTKGSASLRSMMGSSVAIGGTCKVDSEI